MSLHKSRDRGEWTVCPETLAVGLAALADEVSNDAPVGGVLLLVDEVEVASASDLTLRAASLHQLNVHHPSAVVAFAAWAAHGAQ